jgi:hypothetical protein
MAAQRRKKKPKRRGASRPGSGRASAFTWFFAGLVIGLGISAFLFLGGHLPGRPGAPSTADTVQPGAAEPALIGEPGAGPADGGESRFDFFTVLPEMEVIVPDQELTSQGRAAADGLPGGAQAYILQVGSFRSAAEADQMKASLALRGIQAGIQEVTVNGATWHRVRVGPIRGARRADEMRRVLQDHDYNPLVLKDSS